MFEKHTKAVLILEEWFKSLGMQTNIEIPFCGYSIKNKYTLIGTRWDLVAWNNKKFLAVEVKTRYDDVAVNQVVAMLPACREVYLAIYETGKESRMQLAEKRWFKINNDYGVGLIHITDKNCSILYETKNIFPVNKGMEIEMQRISKNLPREGIQPGSRKLINNSGWRWNKFKKPGYFIPWQSRSKIS